MQGRNTSIVQRLSTPRGILVREDYFQHPQGVSNVYLMDFHGKILWDAELPSAIDTFCDSLALDGDAFSCASWNGFSCKFSLGTGRILSREFTK